MKLDFKKFLSDFLKFEQKSSNKMGIVHHDSIRPYYLSLDTKSGEYNEVMYLDDLEKVRCLFQKESRLYIFESPKKKFYEKAGYIDSDSYNEIKEEIIIPNLKPYLGNLKEDLKHALQVRRTYGKSNNQVTREKAKDLLNEEVRWIDEWK